MPKITQRLVTQYGKYRALKNLLDAWMDKQRAIFTAALEAGARCPDLGPYLLELGKAEERLNWKDEFLQYLAAQRISKKERVKLLARIEAKPRPSIPRLHCKKNPNYRRAFPIRLPS